MIKNWTIRQIDMKVKPIRELGTERQQGFMTEITAEVEIDEWHGDHVNIECAWMGDILNLKDITAKVNEAMEKIKAGQVDGVRMTKGGFSIVL